MGCIATVSTLLHRSARISSVLTARAGEALRDLDYMQSKAGGGFSRDPFLLKSSRSAEREMMRKKGFSIDAEWWRDSTEEARWEKVPPSYDDGAPPVLPGIDGSRINNARFRARLYNLMCALLVGLGLIVPMIVMRLVPGKTCTLVTTSSFVMGFAVGLAVLSSFKRSEIVLVTAGYAAVLVVFVGTTS